MNILLHFLAVTGSVIVALLAAAALLHLIPRLGNAGKRFSAALCHAPALDWVVAYFTVAPLIAGPIVAGWSGLIGAIAGQVASVLIWTAAHEFAHRKLGPRPRIVELVNRIVGPWRNYASLWLTAIVTPLFTLIRLAEVLIYPPLSWLVNFPRYKDEEWVNVSRHKFNGLIGHDLIWCLYCDWMTGVWSLGSEMLRNVESFWCPIRFDSGKKCANCSVDFPDIANGWVAADGNMAQVIAVLEKAHSGTQHGWFGHPVRITVGGKELEPADIN
ncbi:MAG: hypothetical protein ABSB74_04370 [Tepidisphaeraceae bacterium]